MGGRRLHLIQIPGEGRWVASRAPKEPWAPLTKCLSYWSEILNSEADCTTASMQSLHLFQTCLIQSLEVWTVLCHWISISTNLRLLFLSHSCASICCQSKCHTLCPKLKISGKSFYSRGHSQTTNPPTEKTRVGSQTSSFQGPIYIWNSWIHHSVRIDFCRVNYNSQSHNNSLQRLQDANCRISAYKV